MLWTAVVTMILTAIAKIVQDTVKDTKMEPVFKWLTIVLLIFFAGSLVYQVLRLKAAGAF